MLKWSFGILQTDLWHRRCCQCCQQHETASSALKITRGGGSPSDNRVQQNLHWVHAIKARVCFLYSPLFLAEVGSWWAGHRRSQLGNLLSDWFVRWRHAPNQSWGPARQCPGPTGSGLPSGSSGMWTPPPLWGTKQNTVCTEVRRTNNNELRQVLLFQVNYFNVNIVLRCFFTPFEYI